MAQHNMDKARSFACELIMLGMASCMLISTILKGWVIDIKLVMPFIMGIGYIAKYIIFVKLEKNGD